MSARTKHTRPRRLLGTAAAVLAAAVALGGCGLGAGEEAEGARLLITQDFGRIGVLDAADPKASGSDTVMRLLQRNAKVTTRYSGGFVQSIDGDAGGTQDGRRYDWFYSVNGIEAEQGAASTRVHDGDVIWWDKRDWTTAQRVPAVVGAFPEPFLHGVDGKRLPARLECVEPGASFCQDVQERLSAVGVLAPEGGLRRSLAKETLRVLVGPYGQLRADEAVRQLERGPVSTGVFAKPSADGKTLTTLDERGRTVQELGPGAGLVAATSFEGAQPIWIITGTDAVGVSAAAAALERGVLANRYAVAVTAGNRSFALPERTRPGAG